jgi:hypothetical protein
MTKNPKIIDQEVGNMSASVNADKWKIKLVELFFFIYKIGEALLEPNREPCFPKRFCHLWVEARRRGAQTDG